MEQKDWREEKTPMGISQWREHGKKYGYWEHFEAQETQRILGLIEEWVEKNAYIPKLGDNQDWTGNPQKAVDYDSLIQLINQNK